MESKHLTLSDLNLLIKDTFDEKFPGLVWVKAEIGELTVNRNGHCYLELVDTDPQSNQVIARARATIWSYSFRMLKPYFETTTGQSFANGLKILVSVKIEFHPLFGLSLNIRDIDPAYTMGDLALKRKEIILRLQQDGIFDMNKDLELPLVPQRIAVISSPTAAGLQDFLHQLANNPSRIYFYTCLFPAAMQGAETAGSVIQALEQVYEQETSFDVVVVIRGGGSQLDLASFDHYELAYHVAQFPIPVITGIGHDKDETIVDLVAHTKMKTPTAVAEFLISGAEAFEQRLLETELYCSELLSNRMKKEKEWLQQTVIRLKQGVRQLVKDEEHQFNMTAFRIKNSVPSFLHRHDNRFVQHRHRLQLAGLRTLGDQYHFLRRRGADLQSLTCQLLEKRKSNIMRAQQGIRGSLNDKLKFEQSRLAVTDEKIRLVDPVQVLKRGYSLTYQSGKLVRSVNDLHEGDQLVTRLYDGDINSKISNFKAHESKKNDL